MLNRAPHVAVEVQLRLGHLGGAMHVTKVSSVDRVLAGVVGSQDKVDALTWLEGGFGKIDVPQQRQVFCAGMHIVFRLADIVNVDRGVGSGRWQHLHQAQRPGMGDGIAVEIALHIDYGQHELGRQLAREAPADADVVMALRIQRMDSAESHQPRSGLKGVQTDSGHSLDKST